MTVTAQDVAKLKSIKEAWSKAIIENYQAANPNGDAVFLLNKELSLFEKAKIGFSKRLMAFRENEGVGQWKIGRSLVAQFEASLSPMVAVFGQKAIADALPAEAKTAETAALVEELRGTKTAKFFRDPYNPSLFQK